MMTPETPLPEVAAYLGQAAAKRLLHESPELQMTVLIAVRSYIMMLENDDVLDPITFQGKLEKFVDCFILGYHGLRHA